MPLKNQKMEPKKSENGACFPHHLHRIFSVQHILHQEGQLHSVHSCGQYASLFFSAFPMFIPSLSW